MENEQGGEMMNFDQVKAALEKRGYAVSSFETAKDAADYLDQQIDEVSVSFGGSLTLSEMGVPKRLALHNTLCLPSMSWEKWIRSKRCPQMYFSHRLTPLRKREK